MVHGYIPGVTEKAAASAAHGLAHATTSTTAMFPGDPTGALHATGNAAQGFIPADPSSGFSAGTTSAVPYAPGMEQAAGQLGQFGSGVATQGAAGLNTTVGTFGNAAGYVASGSGAAGTAINTTATTAGVAGGFSTAGFAAGLGRLFRHKKKQPQLAPAPTYVPPISGFQTANYGYQNNQQPMMQPQQPMYGAPAQQYNEKDYKIGDEELGQPSNLGVGVQEVVPTPNAQEVQSDPIERVGYTEQQVYIPPPDGWDHQYPPQPQPQPHPQ